MSDEIMLVFGEDGVARKYDDAWDITIHCESEEEQKVVLEKLNNSNQEPQWIPCSVSLPEILTPVLVTVKVEDDYKVAHDWVYDNEKWAHYRDVVAWMPLPEPYKEGER